MSTPENLDLQRQLIAEYQQAATGIATSDKDRKEYNNNVDHGDDKDDNHDDSTDNIFQLYSYGKYFYYTRRVSDQPFPIHCRMKKSDFIKMRNDVTDTNPTYTTPRSPPSQSSSRANTGTTKVTRGSKLNHEEIVLL